MTQLIYTQEHLSDLGACHPAVKWAAEHLAEGTPVTRQLLESLPDPLWTWWLACRLDEKRKLVWLTPNIAFREAGETSPELATWAGKITADNWLAAEAAARAAEAAVWAAEAAVWAARAASAAWAVEAAAVAAAQAAEAAVWAAARAASAAWAVEAAAVAAAQAELATAATQWLADNGYIE